MSYSNSEYNLRSRLYKDVQTPRTTKKSVIGRYGSSSLLVPKITKKKRRFAKSQKLPPIQFENGSIHMSMSQLGLEHSSIPKQMSGMGSAVSGFGSNFFREEGEGSAYGKRSYLKGKMLPPVDDVDEIDIEAEENNLSLNKKYLTPLDFAQLVRDDPEMRDEFCYLRKRSDPYDWEIVQFDKIESKKGVGKYSKKKKITLKEYMTISARGIIHFIDEEAYFISLEEWEREYRLYTELKKIKFFKNYKKWKNFDSWRKLRRRTQFKKRRQFLENNMFLIDPKLSSPLLLIRNKCVQIKNDMNIMDMSLKESMDIDEFKNHENMHVVKQAKQIEGIVNEQIKELLETSCKESLDAFKEENRIRNKDNDDLEGDNQNPPLLVGDESNKEMPYTQEATIRTHHKRLKKFIRLVDYLILDSKLAMVNNSVVKVNNYLESNRDVMKFTFKNNGGFPTLINIRADFINEEIRYIPSSRDIKRIFDEVIVLGVNHICDEHKMLLNDPEFATYVNVGDTVEEGDEYKVEIYALATKHQIYTFYKTNILKVIEEIFEYIYEKSSDLNELLEVCIRASRFSRADLEDKERADIYAYIERFMDDDEIIKRLIEKIDVGIFNFSREELKEKLFDISMDALNLIEDNMPDILEIRCLDFTNKMVEYRELLSKPTMEVSEFVEHLDNYTLIRDENDKMTKEYTILIGLRSLFSNDIYRIKVPQSTSSALKKMTDSRDKVRKMLDEIEGRMSSEINRAKKELLSMVPALETDLTALKSDVTNLNLDNENHDPEYILDLIRPKLDTAKQLVATSKDYVFFQDKLQVARSDIEKFTEFEVIIQSYYNFWEMKKDWIEKIKQIRESPVKEVKGAEVTEMIKTNMNRCNVLLKEIDGNSMFIKFKNRVEKFSEVVTVINSFQGEAMREREWEKIYKLLEDDEEIDFEPFDYKSNDFVVNEIIEMNMTKYHQDIQEISVRAAKEEKLLKMLDDIEDFLKGDKSTIVTELYKDSKDIFILGNNDNLTKLLDDKIVTVTNILSSRYVHGIKDKVIEKKKILDYFDEFILELGQCQRMWLYLEPIFNGEENNRELMRERKLFKKDVHQVFTKFMRECHDTFANIRRRIRKKDKKLIEGFREMNKRLDQLEKNLINYLDNKRAFFPRFYFVSNDDLIEILSNGKSLEKLQPHLGKLFEGIHRLGVTETSVTSIISPKGEEVVFKPQMSASDGINEILKRLEEQMIENIKRVIKDAYKDFKDYTDRRVEWIMRHPAQAILTCDSILWTVSTETCFDFDDPWDELEQLFMAQNKELKEVVEKVRGDLPKIKRKMFNSLITQDIRYKNIIMELYSQGAESAEDFDWQKQLRFYMEVSDVICRQSNSILEYAYEYLGVPSKLAITPLTDRCWLTITSALSVNLGCAPVGPAGTGKTESVKDLAKNLGTSCIVFNCSEQVTVQMMQGQFLGMIKTGAWLCLDEFNRINIEVLSVIAQQMLTMRNALNSEANQFFFDSILIKNPEKFKYLGVFTTMNPSYTGRTQLPDNLKVLFRKVAMMVPDYSIIAEVLLSSEGFFNSKELAIKMTKLYKLASEQLSQQSHYDYGMRAIKSILSMAGNLKKQRPEEDEDLLLIQAMKDVNIPKFLDDDKRLFNAIVQDLFPGKVQEEKFDEELVKGIKYAIKLTGLREIPMFIQKCVEFHNTMQIRFGTMLVGPPMNGKSAVLDVIKKAYIYLDSVNSGRHSFYAPVEAAIVNPKSVSMGELLGETNPLTGDFKNGLASKFFTEFTKREDRMLKWLVFDGPVDSLWIENMNSVLDDSRTLCLSNGKRVKLKDDMRVLFEMQDLSHASLATISRVGMIYLDDKVIPPLDMAETIFDREFKDVEIDDVHRIFFFDKLKTVFPKLVQNLRKDCIEPIKTKDNNLMITLIRIFKAIYCEELNKDILKKENEESILVKIFVYALTWSVCCTANSKTAYKLEQVAANMFQLSDLPVGSFDDSFIDFQNPEIEWVKWEKKEIKFNYSKQMKWSELVVPTKNTMKYDYLLRKCITNAYPVYLTGVTGTGKTSMITSILNQLYDEDLISPLTMTFSAKTSSTLVQNQITSKMSTLNRDIVMDNGNVKKISCLIPKNPSHKLVVFIDDINMPEREVYDAQPPIEILRQIIDSNGFYDRELLKWKKLEQTVIIAASIHPGGGRDPISDRFTSKLQIINVPPSGNDVMLHIFGTILGNFLTEYEFRKEIVKMEEKLVLGTLALYDEMTTGMLPTPTKSHYTFNLRDVSSVFQGMIKMRPEKFDTPEIVAKLWVHECERVFCDRLTNEKDRDTFYQYLEAIVKSYTPIEMSKVELKESNFVFADFMNEDLREFEFLNDFEKTKRQIMVYMERTPLRVELFTDFVLHLCRLNRILMQVNGNALLIGVGGSGKKSIVKIASEMAGASTAMIEPGKSYGLREFRRDVFLKMLHPSGVLGKKITFLFTDTHVLEESFLEEINNLINTGEIEIEKDMHEKLMKDIEPEMTKSKTQMNEMDFYLSRVRSNLHVVLAMSPVGNTLRTRLRNFPSFMNCCAIDWVDTWPEEALRSISTKMLKEDLGEYGMSDETFQVMIDMCVYAHQTSFDMAEKLLRVYKRKVYVTPKHFLDLVSSFNMTLKEYKGNVEDNIKKLSSGLTKLAQSGKDVANLQIRLKEMEPVLVEKNKEQDILIQKLDRDKVEANKQKDQVEDEKAIVQEKANEINDIKNEAQFQVEQAKPKLDGALKKLSVLKRGDIAELKQGKMKPLIKDLMECVQIIFKLPTDEASIKSHLQDVNFLKKLKDKSPKDVSKNTVAKLKRKLDKSPDLNIGKLRTITAASVSIFEWVVAIIDCSLIFDQVKELEKKAADIQVIYDEQMAEVRQKEEELAEVMAKVQKLEDEYEENKAEGERLTEGIEATSRQLANAGKLTQGLASEQVRWKETVVNLTKSRDQILGDSMLSSAAIAYFGPFSGKFRQELLKKWIEALDEKNIDTTKDFAFEVRAGDVSKINEWNVMGLPSNSVSICNGILVDKALSYPYMIDPQLQANKWIKKMEEKDQLKVIKANDDNSLELTVENCIRLNIPCMIENCIEDLPAFLDPILMKQYVSEAGVNSVKIGKGLVDIEDDFRIYFTTKIANPKFLPELFIRVSVVNFTVTEEGLEEQLLSVLVSKIMPEIEEEKTRLILSIAGGEKTLRENEDKILELLRKSDDKILENTELIENLEISKKKSDEVKASLAKNESAQKSIKEARDQYKDIARRGSQVYFVICDLSEIDPMYQFSLEYFTKLFKNTIDQTDKVDEIREQIDLYTDNITEKIFLNICRGLFNDHKQIFAFMLAVKIEKGDMEIDPREWSLFLKGVPIGIEIDLPKMPLALPFDEDGWKMFNYFASITEDAGKKFKQTLIQDNSFVTAVKAWADSQLPYESMLPKNYDEQFTAFQKLVLVKLFRPDSILTSIISYVRETLGSLFVSNEAAQLAEVYKDCDHGTPIIFVLSAGSDPLQSIQDFANQNRKKLSAISLGQGQGDVAKAVILEARNVGDWVLLQNCHLSKTFMPELETIIEKFESYELLEAEEEDTHNNLRLATEENEEPQNGETTIREETAKGEEREGGEQKDIVGALYPEPSMEDKTKSKMASRNNFSKTKATGLSGNVVKELQETVIHPNFRLFLTSTPCDYFPITILQNGVKLTNEPPKGIKANMLKAYNDFNPDLFEQVEGEEKSEEWKKMIFCYSIFHSVVLERRKFGPLGWNILYDFNDSDLRTNIEVLKVLMVRYDEVPWSAVKYLTHQINYGGRVTDEWDWRTLNTILQIFINEDAIEDNYTYTQAEEYFTPNLDTIPEYIELIKELPDLDSPNIFGMNQNAEISYQIKESKKVLQIILDLQPNEAGGGENEKNNDEIVLEFIDLVRETFPEVILKEGEKKPTILDFDDSLQVCLAQEIERFNLLISKMDESLIDLGKAIKGEAVMSETLDSMFKAFLRNQVPDLWASYAYPSLKPLLIWYEDLKLRVEFFRNWYMRQKPNSFWLSAFYFPQGFLTSILQNHSRMTEIAINRLDFSFTFRNVDVSQLTGGPEFGCFIHGLYMEGAQMEKSRMILVDSPPGIMSDIAPMIHFKPETDYQPNPEDYEMPLYKTVKREGELSATGQSTNFVLTIYTPTRVSPKYWILNGAAFVCSLD